MADSYHEAPKVSTGRRLWLMVAPDAKKDEDGRDNFNSRTQFVLCAMGGAVGLGNLLRFPSVVYNNYGLQFFVPYFFALFLIGIPILILEIVIGQTYRAGCVTAWNNNNHRAKGIGFSMVFNGFAVGGYYVPILAYAMNYFRRSFESPLPWIEMGSQDFFMNEIVKPTSLLGEDGNYKWYGSMNVIGETAAWSFMIWFVTWMCMFKGVGLTGRVIYITMALPLIMIGILAVRSMSLPNASDGYKLYLGVWRSESLRGPGVWQDAFGQMFFSIGVGFGYFTSYASYSSKYSNAVQDAFIIALCNSAIEIISAFAVMGVVGFLGLSLEESGRLGTFSSGFFYYPEALAQMPAANFFSALFFFTLVILGLTCVFALFEVLVTMIVDTDWGKRVPRWAIATATAIGAYLITLLYCTEVGFNLLDAVDTFVNDLALFFTVWCECFFATTLYRWRDPVDQTGLISYCTYNAGYVLAHFVGLLVGHLVSAEAGAGAGFGIFIIGIVASTLIGKTPTVPAPGFWGGNAFLSRFWYNVFYSGNQLRRDINNAIMVGNNWRLHWFWPACLKYITAPAVGLVFTFAYPKFLDPDPTARRFEDPTMIYSFALMHAVMLFIIGCFIFPRFFNFLIPQVRRGEGKYDVMPQVIIGETPVIGDTSLEAGVVDSNNRADSSELVTEEPKVATSTEKY
ncbi:creatine transporter [Plectosphaerella plurivora]|uniref:Creatine transporter n=1 Tax=Plectosphaerella plurivora TaxID=936078 RepID=A0A9P9A9Y2_9PEZI|nr:creatine transporter [Plectosphaerella plurivora]